jgi:L-amino acid N-acyltransferase YncA
MKKVIALGKTPYVQVVHTNNASLALSQKLGFKKIFEAYWFRKQ